MKHTQSPVGVLLLDDGLRPVYHNVEAANILGYPKKPTRPLSLAALLPATSSQLLHHAKSSASSTIEFWSGRRRYVCRAFLLDHTGSPGGRPRPSLLLVLERGSTQPVDVMAWSDAFQLTGRERETVTFLLRGLTSKEIAARMSISPNTVKAFLKLVMVKVGASTRTGIVAKLLERAS